MNCGKRGRRLVQAALAAGILEFAVASNAVAEEPEVIDIPVRSGEVPAELRTIRVTQGRELTLRWETDTRLDLHLHGYDVHLIVEPGGIAEMAFLAHATGRFSVEAHVNDGHKRILYIEVHPE